MTNSADWFSRKLNGNAPVPTYRPETTATAPPSQLPMSQMPAQFQLAQDPAQLAQSAQSTMSCPECGSANYMSPSANFSPRCYDCGYPIQQQGSKYGSLSTARVEGGVGEARGNDKTNNYNPQGIIGRIE
jgi:hypothetical protein